MKKTNTRAFTVALLCCAVMAQARPAAAQTSQPTGQLSLAQAVSLAKKQNLKLRGARQGQGAATERKRAALGALGPHLWASSGLSFAGGDSAFGSVPGVGDMGQLMNSDAFKFTLGANWSVFSARSIINVKRADQAERSSRHTVEDATQTVVTRVALTFYNLLAAQEGERIARQTVASTASHLAQARSRLAAGSATKADVLRWQARHAADRQAVVSAGQQVATARVQLNNLIGRPLDAPLSPTPPPAALPRPGRVTTVSGAHPQLELARLSVDARALDKKCAQAAFLPSLDLTAGYTWQRYLPHEDISTSTGWLGSWSAGLTLKIPIFDSTAKIFEVRRADRELSRARLSQDDARRALQERLIQADLGVQASYKNVAVARERLEASDAAHRSATALYAVGSATTTDVLDAQKSLAAARYNLRNARYSYLAALAQRDHAAGTTR